LLGLSYKALYENIASNEKQFGVQNVAVVLFEASKFFSLALASAKALQQQYGKKIKEVSPSF
jgi:precorrin-6B methylase 2